MFSSDFNSCRLLHLDLRWCAKVGDAGLAHLRRLTTLEHLDLGYTTPTDTGVAHLAGLTALQVTGVFNLCFVLCLARGYAIGWLTTLRRLGLGKTTLGIAVTARGSWPRCAACRLPIKTEC